MNTFKKIVAAVTVAASIATLGASAQAGDWNRGGYGQGHGAPRAHYAPQPRPYYAHPQYGHRDHRGDKIATGIAIGVGALILGTVLANEANRNNRYNGY